MIMSKMLNIVLEHGIKVHVGLWLEDSIDSEGAVLEHEPTGNQHPSGQLEQSLGTLPLRNVDHVRVEKVVKGLGLGIGGLFGHVQLHWWPHIGQAAGARSY